MRVCWRHCWKRRHSQSFPSDHRTILFERRKALYVEKTDLTPDASWLETLLESLPKSELPQVTTEPSSLSAAKAISVEKTDLTPDASLLRHCWNRRPDQTIPK